MDDHILLLFVLAALVGLVAFVHKDTWFDPGPTLVLRIGLFAFAGPMLCLALIILVGFVLTSLGGVL
jgi:hypothetical protein